MQYSKDYGSWSEDYKCQSNGDKKVIVYLHFSPTIDF